MRSHACLGPDPHRSESLAAFVDCRCMWPVACTVMMVAGPAGRHVLVLGAVQGRGRGCAAGQLGIPAGSTLQHSCRPAVCVRAMLIQTCAERGCCTLLCPAGLLLVATLSAAACSTAFCPLMCVGLFSGARGTCGCNMCVPSSRGGRISRLLTTTCCAAAARCKLRWLCTWVAGVDYCRSCLRVSLSGCDHDVLGGGSSSRCGRDAAEAVRRWRVWELSCRDNVHEEPTVKATWVIACPVLTASQL
jgi:hypothetical protein